MIYLELYWSFLLIGFSSFGGLSMLSQISSEMLSHGWMTLAQVTDIIAIAEMTPGPLGLNCATFAGMQTAGIPGAIAANFGCLTPSLTLTAVAAVFFHKFRESRLMQNILVGVRPVCFGMILAMAVDMILSNYFPGFSVNLPGLAIGLVDLVLLLKYRVSIPRVLLLSALLSLGLAMLGVG